MSLFKTVGFQNQLVNIQEKLYHYGILLTSNREDAMDLLQETTLKALENKEKYTDSDNFNGWVYTIMRNIFINNYRRHIRSHTIVDNVENYSCFDTYQESELETPDGSYSLKEITGAIQAMPDEYKIPFSMHITGYKYHEIAETLHLPIGTVKSRIHFTRLHLQKTLKDYHV